jgi:homoserine O-acetyltransferase
MNLEKKILEEKFPLESGGTLSRLELLYKTYGQLNEQKNNVIWVVHALTANAEVDQWWPGLFGAGKILDPEKYLIICSNNLGSPYGSSCAKNIDPKTNQRYGLNFPAISLRDTANAHLLLAKKLGIESIHLLIGGSCGGNIALEMAYTLEHKLRNLVLLCSAAKESPWNIAIHEAQRLALIADTSFGNNDDYAGKAGLKAARGMALTYYRTFDSMVKSQQEEDSNKLSDYKAASYIRYQGEKLKNRFDAHSYYHLLNVLDTHHIGRLRKSTENALSQIKAKTLCIGISSDLLIPPSEQEFLAKHIPEAKLEIIDSYYGHDGFLLEYEKITSSILEWI